MITSYNDTLRAFLDEVEKVAEKEINTRLSNIAYTAIERHRPAVIEDVMAEMKRVIKIKADTFREYASDEWKVNVTFNIEGKEP